MSPYASHYRNRESLMPRQATEPHLEDGGIYRWTKPFHVSLWAWWSPHGEGGGRQEGVDVRLALNLV